MQLMDTIQQQKQKLYKTAIPLSPEISDFKEVRGGGNDG